MAVTYEQLLRSGFKLHITQNTRNRLNRKKKTSRRKYLAKLRLVWMIPNSAYGIGLRNGFFYLISDNGRSEENSRLFHLDVIRNVKSLADTMDRWQSIYGPSFAERVQRIVDKKMVELTLLSQYLHQYLLPAAELVYQEAYWPAYYARMYNGFTLVMKPLYSKGTIGLADWAPYLPNTKRAYDSIGKKTFWQWVTYEIQHRQSGPPKSIFSKELGHVSTNLLT